MPLFEIAIIQKSTKKEIEDGAAAERLVLEPVFMLAKDGPTASMMAMRDPKVPVDLDLNKTEVLVRPFA